MHTGGFTTIFNYTQRFTADPNDQGTLRAIAATVGQANTAGRINMALDEFTYGIRTIKFRDGEAPDADEESLPVSEDLNGVSTRFQTHDSLTFNVNPKHPDWQEGVRRIFHVLRRPVLCRGHVIHMGIEADCQIRWAHKMVEVRNLAEVVSWVDSHQPQLTSRLLMK